MPSFMCNVCGTLNSFTHFATEPASCMCGSNVRERALIYLLSMELFGRSLALPEFPRIKTVRGLGMSDKEEYSGELARKFSYTNTYYDRDPRMDITEAHPEMEGRYDFVLAADVLEHVPPPIQGALSVIERLLAVSGFLAATVPCNGEDSLREHFPELYQFRIVTLPDGPVLVNRRRDGSLEITEDLVFHGGSGLTLEMRQFGLTALQKSLLDAGFREVRFLTEDVPEVGILFDRDVSQPFIARKQPFLMHRSGVGEIVDALRAAQTEKTRADILAERIRLASRSPWFRLGRRLGAGPTLTAD